MGSKTQTTTQNQNSTYNPTASPQLNTILQNAMSVAQTPYNPYQGQTTAPLNSTQLTGISNVNSAYGTAQPYINTAAGMIQQGSAPITGTQIENYENPYQTQVINATQANMNENNKQQQQQITGNAAIQGALGGDRVKVAQAETARQQSLADNQTIAGLNSQNYQQALSAAQADRTASAQGGVNYANLGTTAQNALLTGANAQLGAGQVQQTTQQAQDTANYNQYLQQQAYPFQTAQWLASIGVPIAGAIGGTTTGTGETTKPGPSGLQQAIGVATTAASFLKDGGRVGYDTGGSIGGTPYSGVSFPSYVPTAQISASQAHVPTINWMKDDPSSTNPFDPKSMSALGSAAGKLYDAGAGVVNSGEAYGNTIGGAYGGSSSDPLSGLTAADYGEGFRRGGTVGGHEDFIKTVHSLCDGLKRARGGAVSPISAGQGFDDGGSVDPDVLRAALLRQGQANVDQGPSPMDNINSAFGAADAQPIKNITDPNNPWAAGDISAPPENIPPQPQTMDASLQPAPMPKPRPSAPPPFSPSPPDMASPTDMASMQNEPELPGDAMSYDKTSNSSKGTPFDKTLPPAWKPPADVTPEEGHKLAQTPQGFSILKALGLPGLGLSQEQRTGLLATGLGILASQSPFAGVAIGEGGLKGMEAMAGYRKEEETKAERQQALKQQGEKLAEEANRWSKTYDIQRENLELNKQKAKDQSETGAWKDVGPGPNGKGVTIMDSKTGKTKVDPSRSYIPTGRNASGLSYINENNTGLTGKDFNETLPVGVGRNVHGLANYDIDPKTIPAYGGQRAAMMEAAQAENPDYKPAEFQFRQGSKLAYMPGKPLGNAIKALDVSVSHVDFMRNLVKELNNGNYPILAKVKNEFLRQTGSPLPTNVDAARPIIASEITKAVTGALGALGDRQEVLNPMNRDGSYKGMMGTLDVFEGLMAGQLEGHRHQYEQATKAKDFEEKLSPHTVEVLSAHANPLPLPSKKEDLVAGKKYINDAGKSAVWSGDKFIPVKELY